MTSDYKAFTPAQNTLFRIYKHNAKKRKHSFELDRKSFIALTKQDCHYCGCPPYPTHSKSLRGEPFTGIDRVDNNLGYVLGNVVPCCYVCNIMKNDLDEENFLTHLQRILDNVYNKGSQEKNPSLESKGRKEES